MDKACPWVDFQMRQVIFRGRLVGEAASETDGALLGAGAAVARGWREEVLLEVWAKGWSTGWGAPVE
jgi:hypothetical protein